MAHLIAQTATLAFGRTTEEALAEGVPRHQALNRTFEENRPTNTILAERLTPQTLGALLALYAHKVFVQGHIWRVNRFTHWSGELSAAMALSIIHELDYQRATGVQRDSSTSALLARYRAERDAGETR